MRIIDDKAAGDFRRAWHRVEQNGVFPEHPALRPGDLDEKVQIRLADWLIARNADPAAVTVDHRRESQILQKRQPLDTDPCKVGAGSQYDANVIGAEIACVQQLDFGTQWLIQSGVERDIAHPQGGNHARIDQRARGHCEQDSTTECHETSAGGARRTSSPVHGSITEL
ncbi:hypothetical protein [Stutzerimonas xanthomarina]|uniref:hypothetical protein n=1 Tax=Stutzerimonas xanthomarina TaxID=271420 RepID=UPI003AA9BC97